MKLTKALGNMLPLCAALLVYTANAQAPAAPPYSSPWRTPWEYAGERGPDHWGALDPEYALCNSGHQQSPIDIGATRQEALPPLRFEYHTAPLPFVTNNGAAIRVDYPAAPGSGDFLIVGEKRYQLTQFHFHRPSEETIHGRRYDMVLHLMHRAADGEVAGVAVLLQAGADNVTMQQVFAHMPAKEGNEAVNGVALDPAGMLPRKLSYYTYSGSQTAPPCNEGVKWFILKTPVSVGAGQIRAYAAIYPHDVRPVQSLNGRTVAESR